MSIHIYLFMLCVSVAGSGYIGYLSGIHSKRNHAYRRGFERGRSLACPDEPTDAQVQVAQQSLLSDVGWIRESYVRSAMLSAMRSAPAPMRQGWQDGEKR